MYHPFILKLSVNTTKPCYNNGIAHQLCDLLRKMEEQLKFFHPTYQPMTWPLKPQDNIIEPPRDELSDIFDDIDKAETMAARWEEEEGTS
jgi:hypothetical protein